MRKSMKKSVSFAPLAGFYNCLHLNDYTDAEIAACFYNTKEQNRIQAEAKHIVMLMKFDQVDKKVCTRGLEAMAVDLPRTFKKRRAIAAVLEEQNSQYAKNIFHPDRIAKVYSKQTRESKQLAVVMGYMDQAWILRKLLSKKNASSSCKQNQKHRARVTSLTKGGIRSVTPSAA